MQNVYEPELGLILKEKIRSKLSEYYNSDKSNNYRIHLASHLKRSNSYIFVYEIYNERSSIKKILYAKHYYADKTSESAPTREYDMLRTLFDHPNMGAGNYHVPRPLDIFPDLRTVLTEQVEGINLIDFIGKNNRMASPRLQQGLGILMNRCGNALKEMHDITDTGRQSSLGEDIYNDLYMKLADSYDYLAKRKIELLNNQERQHLWITIDRSIAKIRNSNFRRVRIHGDYGFSNLIVNNSMIIIIDFAFSRESFPYADISSFMTSFVTINPFPKYPFFDFWNIKRLREQFLRGYFKDVTSVKDDEWILLHLFMLRNVIIHSRVKYEQLTVLGIRGYLYFTFLRKIYANIIGKEIRLLEQYLG